MASLLNIIFLIVLCAVFALLFTAFGIFRTIYNFKKKFNDLTGGNGNRKGSGFGNSSGFGSYSNTDRSNGYEIIDNRNPERINRKIFPYNEGEYVDFEEE